MDDQDLRAIQLRELDILRDFHRVCQALGLTYYLTAGTLLGAVRHQGFIPWDDDIDVAMPRADYERFIREGQALLDAGLFVQSWRTEPNFPYEFAKIRQRGTRTDEPILRAIAMDQGIFIDIFPLDPCPDRDGPAGLFFKLVELLNCCVLARVSREFVCGYTKPGAKLLWRLLRHLPNRWLFALRDGVRKAAGWRASGRRLCTVSGHHGYPRETYDAAWFGTRTTLPFEGDRFPAPGGWHELLQHMYGDYLTPPPESDRQGHFVVPQKERNDTP